MVTVRSGIDPVSRGIDLVSSGIDPSVVELTHSEVESNPVSGRIEPIPDVVAVPYCC
jgi:hypothetical protein